ncbi:hypothetical protein SM007_36815 [Streptomyces avermitilis]|nr:hypothetical protein [Streptomyces avermitilis]OOV18068.1 hypothetical protein SM007_36815 [Streptomyces avermitilis]GDY68015.1 hypothetical protein SAV14893_074080 [Streptomyces avermitilis]GDY71652.1 hypothetical protein SAV31267_011370 [Streptomyces avermitilis]
MISNHGGEPTGGAGYRRHVRGFKAEVQNATTIQQRRQVQRTYQQLLERVGGPGKELVTSFGEQFTKAATARPEEYSQGPLSDPATPALGVRSERRLLALPHSRPCRQ